MSRKLPARLFQPAFGIVMAITMSFLMSGVITTLNVGLPPDFLARWMRAWGLAFMVALPVILTVAPLARRLTLQFVESPFSEPVQG
ncbi:DUF2798 domain-containing protein [Hyphomonas sp.]|uniref:DUF2798 domain-containing protein n=1 Tax=Hyphomonas sp. TaxID=87 RepID=UPI00391B8AB6